MISANASYETLGGHMDPSSLSRVAEEPGAYVELMWWPAAAGEKPEAQSPLLMMGAAQADAHGRYEIAARPTPAMAAAAVGNDGWLNFLLAVSTGEKYVLESLSRHWNGSAWTSYGDERPGMSPRGMHQTVFATDVRTGLARYGTNPKLRERHLNPAAVAAGFPSSCLPVVQSLTLNSTVVIEMHNVSDSDGRWEYGGTADSDIDMGINYSGSLWTTSGTAHVGTSYGSAIFGTSSTLFGQYIGTTFRYEHGFLNHAGIGFCDYAGDSFIRVNRWEGGGIAYMHDVSQYDCQDSPQSSYRDYYPQGTGFTKNENRAFRFGIAVGFAGVSLGATSGYSSRVDMTWSAQRSWLYICGNNAKPRFAQIVYVW